VNDRNTANSFHDTNTLLRFKIKEYQRLERDSDHEFKSPIKDQGEWLKSVHTTLPQPMTQVCYGGVFVTAAKQIRKRGSKVWSSIEKSLSRGDNIQESHYAERSWAGLLAYPTSVTAFKHLQCWLLFIKPVIKRQQTVLRYYHLWQQTRH